MGAVIELDTLLSRIQQVAIEILDCERVAVFLYDEQNDELRSRISTGLEEIRLPAGKGIVGEAIRTKEVINVSDPYSDPRFYPEVDRETGFKTRNLLAFPMTGYSGEIVGALEVLNKQDSSFTPLDEDLASILSSLAGVAVQRQMLLEEYAEKQKLLHDLSVAREIQQSLLPPGNPEIPGFDIAGWNKPAEDTGGDYFDFIRFPGEEVGLVLADVTGHGIGPALLTSECRALMRAVASLENNPAEVITRVNELLYGDLDSARFITLYFGVLKPKSNEIPYLSAGQAPLIFYSEKSGEGQFLEATTVPLGILPTMKIPATPTLRMEPGDTLALLTDGFFEWENEEGEPFGKERILDLIKMNRDLTSEALIAEFYREVLEFAGGTPQADDLTAVVVRKL